MKEFRPRGGGARIPGTPLDLPMHGTRDWGTPPRKVHGTRDYGTPLEGTWDQRLGYPRRKDLGPESGEETGNLTGVSPPPPPPGGGQTEMITLPNPSDAGGNDYLCHTA